MVRVCDGASSAPIRTPDQRRRPRVHPAPVPKSGDARADGQPHAGLNVRHHGHSGPSAQGPNGRFFAALRMTCRGHLPRPLHGHTPPASQRRCAPDLLGILVEGIARTALIPDAACALLVDTRNGLCYTPAALPSEDTDRKTASWAPALLRRARLVREGRILPECRSGFSLWTTSLTS